MKIELSGHYNIRRLVLTSIPLVGMMIATSIYNVVDGLFVANFAGTTAFASINIIWPAIALMSALGLMIGSGGSALVSKTLGEGNKPKAQSVFTQLIILGTLLGISIAVLFFILMKPIVLALGAEGEMVMLAVRYGRIVVLALPFFILQMAFQSFFMTAEKPELGTFTSIICGILNIALDALFIIVLKWGVIGAATATAVSLTVGGLYPVCFFASKRNQTHLQFAKTGRIDWKSIIKSCTNGLSEYVGNIALSIVSIGYNIQLMRYIGQGGVSAYGIIMYVAFIFGAVTIGFNMCATQIIAYNYGAENKAELRSLLKKSLWITAATSLIMTGLAELSAPWLSSVFVGHDESLRALTERAIRIYMLCYIPCGFNVFCSAWFTALNNGIISAISSFVRTLVLELAAVFIMPSIFGIDGIWASVCVAEGLALILTFSLIFGFRHRYQY